MLCAYLIIYSKTDFKLQAAKISHKILKDVAAASVSSKKIPDLSVVKEAEESLESSLIDSSPSENDSKTLN